VETEARLSSGSGDQEVRGLKGPVIAKAGSGDVQIEDIEGDVDVAIGSGDIVVAGVRSSVSADVGRGDIDLRGITGRVSLRAGSGDVALHELGGSTDVSIGHGDISLESPVADGAEWVFKVGSGDVSLLLPSDSEFKLRAVSVSGEIEADFGLEPSGRMGMRVEGQVGENPTSGINVKTAHGDIEIKAR